MRTLREMSYSNCHSRTRSDEFETQPETLEDATQVLDDFPNGFGSDLADDVCCTQVIDDEGKCHTERRTPIGEDNNFNGFEDMEGDTQVLNDPKDVSVDQLANFGTDAEINENGACDENLCTQILDDHCERPCTEGVATTSYGQITVGCSGRSSSREIDHIKSSSDCLTIGTVDHTSGTVVTHTANNCDDTSGYVPPRFTEIRIESLRASAAAARSRLEKKNSELNCSSNTYTSQPSQKLDNKKANKPGYVPLRFTEIRVESLIASGLAAKQRALNKKNAATTSCSVCISPAKQDHFDKESDKNSELNCSNTNSSQPSQRLDNKKADKPGYVPLRFTEIRVESLIASGLAAKQRALNKKNAAGTSCSVCVSPAKQECFDKENDNSLKESPSSMEGTDDEDFNAFHEPKDGDLGKGRKVKSSAVRKLFAEELVSQIEDCGITVAGDNESELPVGEGETGAAWLDSQEPNELAQAKALDFVDKYLTANLSDIDTNDLEGSCVKKTKAVSHSSTKSLVKKSIFKTSIGFSRAFDWDDHNEDEGGGAFFCKLKEKSKKESHFPKSAPPIPRSYLFDSEKLQTVSEQLKGTHKKRKLSYSDSRMISQDVKNIVKNFEGSPKQNILNLQKRELSTDNNSAYQSTPDVPIADKDMSASTLKVSEPHAGHEVGASETISIRRTRKGSYIKEHNLSKSVRTSSHKVSEQKEGTGLDASLRNHDAMCIEQTMENPACDRRKTRSANNLVPTLVISKAVSSTVSAGQIGHVEPIKPIKSNLKTRGRSICDQPHRTLSNKGANPRRSCRLNKVTELEDSCKQQKNQGPDGRALVHTELINGTQAMRLPLQVDGYHSKRTRTITPTGLDPVEVNSTDRFFNVFKDRICQVQPVEHSVPFIPTSSDKIVGGSKNISSGQKRMPIRRSHRLNGSSVFYDASLQKVHKQASADITKEQNSLNALGTSVNDTSLNQEASLRTSIPCMECVTPTNSVKPSEEASPICMGNEYYKISCNQNLPRSDLKKEGNNLVACPSKVTSGRKGSKRRRVMTEVQVLFSQHLDEDTQKHQKKLMDRLGASVASSISDATHFIADKFVRTKNMLEAIALGKPVVTPLWLVSCCKKRFPVDEKSFILRDEKKEIEIGFSMPVSLDLARRQPLLQKRRVFITPNTKPGKESIACLVKAVCGQVIGRIGRSALRDNKIGDDILILTCEEDFAFCEPFLSTGAKVYSSELLLNGIVTQRLEFERYRLFNDRVRRTRSMLRLKD